MIQVTRQMRIWAAIEAVDFGKGIDSLVRVCEEKLQARPVFLVRCSFFEAGVKRRRRSWSMTAVAFGFLRWDYPGVDSSGRRVLAMRDLHVAIRVPYIRQPQLSYFWRLQSAAVSAERAASF